MSKNDDLLFNLAIPNQDGSKSTFQFTQEGLRSLVMQVLSVASQAPMAPSLDRHLTLDDNPIPANGFAVTPLEDDPVGAHVSIGIGPIDLQFAVSLDALLLALDDLKRRTEPDPTSSHRPN